MVGGGYVPAATYVAVARRLVWGVSSTRQVFAILRGVLLHSRVSVVGGGLTSHKGPVTSNASSLLVVYLRTAQGVPVHGGAGVYAVGARTRNVHHRCGKVLNERGTLLRTYTFKDLGSNVVR